METGTPEPAVRRRGTTVWVAYRCANPNFPGWESGASPDHPGFDDYCAVLKFEGVGRCTLGPPSDELQHEHQDWDAGMEHYSFMRLYDTELQAHAPDVGEWIITFHDDTLEVQATAASVVAPRVNVESPLQALHLCMPARRGGGVDVRFDFGMLIRKAALKEKGIAPDPVTAPPSMAGWRPLARIAPPGRSSRHRRCGRQAIPGPEPPNPTGSTARPRCEETGTRTPYPGCARH